MSATRPSEIAALLFSLTEAELATEAGRARLDEGLRDTLALLTPAGCAACPMARPGVRRALAGLVAHLADAVDHAEYLELVMGQPPRR